MQKSVGSVFDSFGTVTWVYGWPTIFASLSNQVTITSTFWRSTPAKLPGVTLPQIVAASTGSLLKRWRTGLSLYSPPACTMDWLRSKWTIKLIEPPLDSVQSICLSVLRVPDGTYKLILVTTSLAGGS